MLRLHYVPGTAAMAPHAALAEAGAEYTLVLVAPDEYEPRPSAYLALNPWGQVPTLEDGDLVLTEAAAIMMHIADRFPAAGLSAPVGSRARSQISQWLAYLSTAFQTAYMRWFYPDRFTTDPRRFGGSEGRRRRRPAPACRVGRCTARRPRLARRRRAQRRRHLPLHDDALGTTSRASGVGLAPPRCTLRAHARTTRCATDDDGAGSARVALNRARRGGDDSLEP